MKKRVKIILICTIMFFVLFGILYINKEKLIFDNKDSKIYDNIETNEEEIITNTIIQGIVEINDNGYIYIFNGQHFGEYGFEMEEYTRANIDNKNQLCIDYTTNKEYDTTYIEDR